MCLYIGILVHRMRTYVKCDLARKYSLYITQKYRDFFFQGGGKKRKKKKASQLEYKYTVQIDLFKTVTKKAQQNID